MDPPRQATENYRICLRCLRLFWSEGPGNRRCPKCELAVRDVRMPTQTIFYETGGRLRSHDELEDI